MTDAGPGLIETRGIGAVPADARYGSPFKLGTLWFGSQLSAANMLLGALGPALGLDLPTSALIIISANVAGGLFPAYASMIGPAVGRGQMDASGAVFGGFNRVPALILWVTTVGWGGLNALFGIVAVSLLLGIPLSWGIVLCFLGQITLSIMGHEAVHRFAKMLSVVMALIFIVMTWRILAGGHHPAATTLAVGNNRFASIVVVFMAQMSAVMTWAPFASDYSRYLPASTRRLSIFGWAFAGSTFSAMWVELLGLLVAGLVIQAGIMGTPSAMQALMGGHSVLGTVTLLAVFLNSLCTNAIDYYTGGLSLQVAGIRLPRPMVVAGMGLLTFFVSLWFLYGGSNLLDRSESFLLLVGYWVTPWCAVIFVDWQLGGAGRAAETQRGGAAITAFLVGCATSLPFSRTDLGDALYASAPHSPLTWLFGGASRLWLHGADVGFVAGFVAALILYAALRLPRTMPLVPQGAPPSL